MNFSGGGVLALSFAGMVDTLYLSLSRDSGPISCHVTEGCGDVLNSVYSEVGGIPLSWFGLAFYVAVFAAAVFEIFGGSDALRLIFWPAAAAVAVSVALTGIQVFVPGSLLRVLPDFGGTMHRDLLCRSECQKIRTDWGSWVVGTYCDRAADNGISCPGTSPHPVTLTPRLASVVPPHGGPCRASLHLPPTFRCVPKQGLRSGWSRASPFIRTGCPNE